MANKNVQRPPDPAMGFLKDKWRTEKISNPDTPGFRAWLHKSGILSDDDIVEIYKREVPLPEEEAEEDDA